MKLRGNNIGTLGLSRHQFPFATLNMCMCVCVCWVLYYVSCTSVNIQFGVLFVLHAQQSFTCVHHVRQNDLLEIVRKFLFVPFIYMYMYKISVVRQIERELSMRNCCWWQQCSHASSIVWPEHISHCLVEAREKRWRSNELTKTFFILSLAFSHFLPCCMDFRPFCLTNQENRWNTNIFPD